MINNHYYQTSDLSLAAAISLSYPLDSVDKTNPVKVIFLFERESGLDNLVESFWRGELRVDPVSYFNQLKLLKSRIYQENF